MEAVFKFNEYEGPLDLLLHLINKNKLNILDVSLAEITDQYFEYINAWKEENIDFSSEFLVVASELLYIKSKMLLSSHDEETEQSEDEMSLVERLKEYRLFKLCSQKIEDRQFESKYLFFKLAEQIKFPAKPMKEMPVDLLGAALVGLADRKEALRPPDKSMLKEVIVKKPVSIFAKVKDILKRVKRKAKIKYKDLFVGTRSERVASFLAILELIKLNRIKFDANGEDITISDERR